MTFERIAVDAIQPSAYNPRKDLAPSDPEYQALERSLARWDSVEPLVWNRRTGNLVGGHQRLKILMARGDTEVDVSVVDLDLTEEQALNVALNKTGGAWDDRKLFDVLSALDTAGVDVTLTGFAADDLGALARALETSGPLFTPATPGDLNGDPVQGRDMTAASVDLARKFAQKPTKVEDVMCPHCGHVFGLTESSRRPDTVPVRPEDTDETLDIDPKD